MSSKAAEHRRLAGRLVVATHNPGKLKEMREWFDERSRIAERKFVPVELNVSFRSTPAVLDAVDWVFGEVHTRDGLTPRERELIIVAVLTAIGSSDPQVAAHIRALRAIDVPWQEIEETILQTAPYAGIPRAINALKVLRTEQGR